MIKNFRQELLISTCHEVYLALEVELHGKLLSELDPAHPVKAKARLPKIPSENHPWRRNSFDMLISKRYAAQLYSLAGAS